MKVIKALEHQRGQGGKVLLREHHPVTELLFFYTLTISHQKLEKSLFPKYIRWTSLKMWGSKVTLENALVKALFQSIITSTIIYWKLPIILGQKLGKITYLSNQ